MTVAAAFAAPAAAQIRSPSPEEILRLSPQMQIAVQTLADEPCRPSAPSAAEQATNPVRSLTVEGSTVFSPAERQSLTTAAKPGSTVSSEALTRAADTLVCAYRRDGFVFAHARVEEAGEGAWRIVVDEGVLNRLEAAVEDPHLAAALRRAFVGLRPGRPINANAVRRGLVLATAAGIPDVRPTVRKSRSDPRKLDIVLVAAEPKTDFGLQVQNSNSRTLGRWGGLASVEIHGLTPLYERTDIGVFQSLEQEGQTTFQLSSRAVLPKLDGTVALDFAYSHAAPEAYLEPLDIDSRSWFARISFDRYLNVRRGLISHATVGLDAVEQSTDFLGGVPLIRDRLRVLFGKVQGETLAWGGVFNGGFEVRQGLDALGALTRRGSLLSVAGSDPQATVWRADAAYAHTLGKLSLRGTVRGQWSDHTLTSFEQITFGALNGGFGFDPAAISGDRGVALTFEAQGPVMKGPMHTAIRPFVFSDAARITTVGPGPYDDWAVSAGLGVRVAAPGRVNFSLIYAAPIASGGALPDSSGPRVLFGLDWSTNNPLASFREQLSSWSRKR